MKNYKQDLTFYYEACNLLARTFAKQYFCNKNIDLDDLDYWWISSEIGGVICISDYYWDIDTIAEALKVGVNTKTLFDYYDWMTDDNKIENKSLHYYLNLKKLNQL